VLTTYEEKIEEIKSFGADEILIIKVPSEVLRCSHDKFFDDFLCGNLKVSKIICGADFAFGKNRKGDIEWLKKKAKAKNVEVEVVNPLKNNSKKISSSYIRDLIEKGDLKKSSQLLGRKYSFTGMPFKEKGIGRKLGFPTINLKVGAEKLLPRGVYISLISQGTKIYPSVTNIGTRVTFNRGNKVIPETHILNFKGKWKTARTKVVLVKKMRNEKKFKNAEALKIRISKDVLKASRFFKIG
jgi:riboflavin kinase/FMN adenylyltransferase